MRSRRRGHAGSGGRSRGGVFKKRLDKNRYRSIILAKGGRHWFYQYLFAKKDRANIAAQELDDFRILAKALATLSEGAIAQRNADGDLVEICHDRQEAV